MQTKDDKQLFIQANELWDAGDANAAFKLFKLAAEQGDAYAQNSLGYFFDLGIAGSKNKTKALYWYKLAAKNKEVTAYSNIGTIYRDTKNFQRARFWFMKAFKSGDGDAALELAKLYLARKYKKGLVEAKTYLRLALKSKNVTQESREEANQLLNNL